MDQTTAQMSQIEIKDTLEQSPISRSASPQPPCPYLPPEIVFDIFSKISHTSYDEEKSTFARLCLVNRAFLPVAREFLYSSLNLYLCTNPLVVIAQRPGNADKVEKGLQLFGTLVEIKHLAFLVKEVYVSFANLPPLSDDSVQIGGLIRLMENIKKIWFKDEGGNWWESRKNAKMPDDLMFLRVILSRTQQLESLALPQVRFRPIETFHLLNSLKHLTTFKGELHAPSSGSRLKLRLTHLYVTRHTYRRDLEYYIDPSSLTLRYIHLNFDGETPLIPLDKLRNLEQLVITVDGRSAHCSLAHAHSTNFDPFLKSCKYLPHLSSFTLNFENDNPMFSRLFCNEPFAGGLPIKLKEFAIGPKSPLDLTWRTFLHHAPPQLRTLHLVELHESWDLKEIGRDNFLFGVEDLEKEKGIQVEWMKPENWGEWMEDRFCSRDE